MTVAYNKFRITLYPLDTSTGWRSSSSNVIYDPIEVGVTEKANDVGEAYWVLPNTHPLIGVCLPLKTHYEIHRYDPDADAYKWVGSGILNDTEISQNETTFRGIDYMAVFNQYYTPTVALTFTSTSYLSPDISNSSLSSIFTFSAGSVNDSSSDENQDPATGLSAYYSTNNKLYIDNVVVSSVVADTLTIGPATITTSSVYIEWDASYTGTISTHFQAARTWRFRIDVTPPAGEAPQVPTTTGGAWEKSFTGDSNIYINNSSVKLYPYESKQLMYNALISAGQTSAQANNYLSTNQHLFALRKGVSYSATIHGAVYRTNCGKYPGVPHWLRSGLPKKTDKFTLGSGYETFTQIFDRVFNAAKTTFPLSRIRYASRSISGSPSTTLMTWSAGEPSVTYLANTARLEMVKRTDGNKVIFGPTHPSSTGSYDGTFRIRYNVSSANISTIQLSYPESLRGYSYSDGGGEIFTHIRVIPSTPFLAGTSTTGAVGISIDGATATTGESSIYGEIPKLVTQAGFIDEAAAQYEAERLADSAKTDNAKSLDVILKEDYLRPWDGWDLGDAVSVHVVHGNVSLQDESLNIAGMEWVGYSDGHEELTLELVQGNNF